LATRLKSGFVFVIFFLKYPGAPYGMKLPKYMIQFLSDELAESFFDGILHSWHSSPEWWARNAIIMRKIDDQGVYRNA